MRFLLMFHQLLVVQLAWRGADSTEVETMAEGPSAPADLSAEELREWREIRAARQRKREEAERFKVASDASWARSGAKAEQEAASESKEKQRERRASQLRRAKENRKTAEAAAKRRMREEDDARAERIRRERQRFH